MAYKPKFISLDCYWMLINFEMGPAAKRMRVSSSLAYDLITANDLGFMANAFIDRTYEPACDGYGVNRLTDFRQLPGLPGLDGPTFISETGRVA
jgi:2-haloacid dehalogenase